MKIKFISLYFKKRLFFIFSCIFLNICLLVFSNNQCYIKKKGKSKFFKTSTKGIKKTASSSFKVRDLNKYVDQNIGIGVGKCSFGVSLPFGSIRPCPHTPKAAGTGYSATEKITGFTLVNSGMVNKYVNLLISPQTGLDCWDKTNSESTNHDSGKANEICRPDYYSVDLTKFGIKTEFTSAHYSSIFRFTYPETKNGEASMIIYPSHALWAKSTYSTVNYDPVKNRLIGYIDITDGWYFSKTGKIYYAIQFNKPLTGFGMFDNNEKKLYDRLTSVSGSAVGCYLQFNTSANEKIYLKAAVSTKSIANAQKFMDQEIPGWDFEKVRSEARDAWNKALSSILIDDENISEKERTFFYTALYHSLISPKDRTGDCPWDYSGSYYDDEFCVWDTFRSEFPFLTLIKEGVVRDNINSYCEIFKHFGYAPDAFLCGEGDMVQGGDNVDVIVADAFVKGVPGIDWTSAYHLLKGHATVSGRTPYYRENDRGWVPYNTIHKMAYATASKTLEFAYNDFCASEVAGGLGFIKDKNRFFQRSTLWTNLWNPEIRSEGFNGFIESKDSSGSWVLLDPKTNPKGSFSLHFYEGNSWTYSYYVPHQMGKLIGLMGGDSIFTRRLENYLTNRLEISNEPCFLTPFLFNYVSRPDLTSFYVRKTAENFTTGSYPGDDDSGAMSTWFMFSRMGFFPVAGQNVYLINGPRYKKVTIQMENGKKIIINGTNASAQNLYVQSLTLNGKTLNHNWFKHSDIKNGAVFNFSMSSRSGNRGLEKTPPSY